MKRKPKYKVSTKPLKNDPPQKRVKKMGVDWSQLPNDILYSIADRFALEDFAVLIAVCTSWLFALSKHPCTTFPCLLAKENYNSIPYKSDKVLLKCLCREIPIPIPIPHNNNSDVKSLVQMPITTAYWGSPTGWIFCQNHPRAQLINPVTRVRVPLPQLDHNMNIRKGLVFKRPMTKYSSDHLHVHGSNVNMIEVVAISYFRQDIMVAAKRQRRTRQGYYKEWITVQNKYPIYNDDTNYGFVDLVRYKNGVYAICSNGTIVIFDYDRDGKIIGTNLSFAPPKGLDVNDNLVYLVESAGELLIVVGNGFNKSLTDPFFQVYKFNLKSGRWKKVEDLGNRSLFVGDRSYSMSIAIKDDDDECNKWKGNCIYFTPGKLWQDFIGCFDMKKKRMEFHYHDKRTFDLVWFKPSCY